MCQELSDVEKPLQAPFFEYMLMDFKTQIKTFFKDRLKNLNSDMSGMQKEYSRFVAEFVIDISIRNNIFSSFTLLQKQAHGPREICCLNLNMTRHIFFYQYSFD